MPRLQDTRYILSNVKIISCNNETKSIADQGEGAIGIRDDSSCHPHNIFTVRKCFQSAA